MAIGSAIGFAIIGYAILGAGAVAAASARDKAKKEKSTRETEASRLAQALEGPPTAAEATPEQKARIRRRTKTILSQPLTGEEEFGTPAPTLLGSGDVTKKGTLG